jgi:carbonic anhydrase/SulP family sulfate permease
VPVLGANGLGLGDLLQAPAFARIGESAIWISGVTLAIVASLETLLNLEATEKLDPLRRPSHPNRELVAQGVGNMVCGLLGGLPLTSVIVRSSVNVNAGGRTRWSAIAHGVLLLVSVLFLARWINHVPLSALAAVLIVTGWKLAHPTLFAQKWRAGWLQFVPFLTTVLAIVFTDLLIGVLVGLFVSLSFVFGRNLRGGFRVIRESHVGGVVHRIEFGSQASFLNRARLLTLLGRFQAGDHVALDARQSDYVDSDLLSLVREFAEENAPARGIVVSLIGFQERYQLKDVVQYVDYTSREVQATLKPAHVLQILREGNERFLSGNRLNRDLARQVDATKSGQHPMAIVVSCIDSRAPAELLFDVGIGDIFSCRLAGNVARRKALGSIEFATKVAGSRLVVVLGHTRCGAVKATCEFVGKGIDPASTGMTNLVSITSVISESVREEQEREPGHDCTDPAFVDRVAATHVGHTIEWMLANSPTLQELLRKGEIGVVGAMYDVTSGRVTFLESGAHGVDGRAPATGVETAAS